DQLLQRRAQRLADYERGILLDFPDETREIRAGDWTVAPAPDDLQDRRVEITGPVDRKMMINALNSGASVFMADFEDSLSPTWANVIEGQANLMDAVRRELAFRSPEGKEYRLNDRTATLLVRPRGWHLLERHVTLDGVPVSASLFDFGIYFFHNAAELLKRGSGPYFYLPKMESHLEAQLWNRTFNAAQDLLGIPRGTIRATVLIETLNAAFAMDEILWELREHAAGLNAGRWDYIFSIIRTFPNRDLVLPDRSQVTMTAPFMRAYTDLLVHTCHRRGAHAIGGMAAFIPSRRDEEVNRIALDRVRQDKEREVHQGFDGTWVAHPDLVPVARESFDRVLGDRPHQKHVLREDVAVTAAHLTDFRIKEGKITENGVRTNIEIALLYLDSWLQGVGAAAIHNLMEDAATAEISRAQLWQWVHHRAKLDDGRQVTPELYREIRDQELRKLGGAEGGQLREAAEILDSLVLSRDFVPFLTVEAYERLE
ncbi:MAG TPA: malate synthase A, partial [Thermoanaerobaculia bacterium]|nr:malate synthase A [Thermoanaerobaculia bacterium]